MSLLDLLTQQLGGDTVSALGRQIGASPDATQKALAGAIPALMGALSRNAQDPQGAQALDRALARDHDGSILDSVDTYVQRGDTRDGDAILGHVLGNRRQTVETAVGRASGLDMSAVQKLLPLLAPVVLGMLGKQRREEHLDAGGLASMLGQEQRDLESQAPGLLNQILDADGDGSVLDDVAGLASRFLSGR